MRKQHRNLPILHELVGEAGIAPRDLLGDDGECADLGRGIELHAAELLGNPQGADAELVGLFENGAAADAVRVHLPFALPIGADEGRDDAIDEGPDSSPASAAVPRIGRARSWP